MFLVCTGAEALRPIVPLWPASNQTLALSVGESIDVEHEEDAEEEALLVRTEEGDGVNCGVALGERYSRCMCSQDGSGQSWHVPGFGHDALL